MCLGPVVHVRVDISHSLYMPGVHGPLFKIGNGNLKWSMLSGLGIAGVIMHSDVCFINFWSFRMLLKCVWEAGYYSSCT